MASLPDDPVKTAQLVLRVSTVRSYGIEITEAIFNQLVTQLYGETIADQPRILDRLAAQAEAQRSRPSVVYYVRIGALIKIGRSVNLVGRLQSYPPNRQLLATEPGGPDTEQLRLEQFDAALAHGREWFHPSAELIAHINSLREQPLSAAELAG